MEAIIIALFMHLDMRPNDLIGESCAQQIKQPIAL